MAGIYGFSNIFLTEGIALYGSILNFVPLKKTSLESYVSLLPWVQTWIGVNNIEPLTHEGWFEEVHGFKGGKKNSDGVWMTCHSKGTFYGRPPLQ